MEKIIDMAMVMSHNYQGTVTFNCCFGNTCTSTMTTSTTMLVMMGNYSGSHHLTNTVKRYDCQLQTLSEDPFQQ